MDSKITPEALARIAETSLQDQLIAHMDELLRERRRRHLERDQDDAALDADASWSGQQAKLRKTKGWDTP